MRYAVARFKQNRRDTAYRIYITEGLRITTENLAKQSSGKYLTAKFSDYLKQKPKENRTAEQIIADTITRAGLEVVE